MSFIINRLIGLEGLGKAQMNNTDKESIETTTELLLNTKNSNTDKENEWKKEWSKLEAEYFTNTGFLPTRGMVYLQACRARQVDIDFWKEEYVSHSESLQELIKETKTLKAELETARELIRESFCFLDFIIDYHDSLGQCRKFKQKAKEFLKKEGE